MRLVGEINRRTLNLVAQFSASRGVESGQIRHGTAADKEAAGRLRETAKAPEPIDHVELERRRGRTAQPRPVENVEPGSERVRHGTNEISRPWNESEKARM